MTIELLAAVGELIGGIGVLFTLLFLILEVRRNTKILQVNAKTAGMESFAAFNELLSSDSEVANLLERLGRGEAISSFTPSDRFRATTLCRALIQRMEAQFFQYKAGIIDENYWRQRMNWLKGFLTIPEMENWWEVEARSSQYTDEFVEHVNAFHSSMKMGHAGQTETST